MELAASRMLVEVDGDVEEGKDVEYRDESDCI
jgi:hypothetical protein